MLTDNDLKSYITSYYLDRKMTYTKLDKHDRAIGVLLEENKQLKEQLENKIDLYEDTISYQLGFNKGKEYMQQRIDKAIEEIKTIKQHYEELRKAPFEDSVFINDMLRQSFITTIESYLDLFLEILGDKENE